MKYLINKIKWYLQYYKYMYLVNAGEMLIHNVPDTYKTPDMFMVYQNTAKTLDTSLYDYLWIARNKLIAASSFYDGFTITLKIKDFPRHYKTDKYLGFNIIWE